MRELSILDTIYHSSNSTIYKIQLDGEDKPYILKMLPQEYPEAKKITQFNLEHELTKDLNISGVRKAVQRIKYQDHFAIILEYFEGKTLREFKEEKWTLPEFLPIAISLAETIGAVHQANIIHKDINPNNIMLDDTASNVCLIDFGIATKLSNEIQQIQSPKILDGTLHYISPEQTGRMNRNIDYRSDLYSLGVVFYEMLLGKRPFESIDPMELVHHHIAGTPDVATLPKQLDKIITKLLSKNAEDRYQSAFGLKYDLEQCLANLEGNTLVADFPLGSRDYAQHFRIPQKLYGRDEELFILMHKFSMVSQGTSQFLLIGGYSGIGKSALVNEIQKPITAQKGYFIGGKFDQFQRNIPYYAFIRAFEVLMAQLLTEQKESLEKWKAKILDAVGNNGEVIASVIPAIEYIIGEQPPVKPLPPLESQNRFNLTFLNFIKVFAQAEHPLVIFIDDLQWSDLASLRLIENLMLDEDIRHLLLIGAYRDNEVDAAHPLILSLDGLQKQLPATIQTITLAPLKEKEVTQLVADTLAIDRKKAQSLSDLIYEKTKGNPFFVTQFFKKLKEDRLVYFDFSSYQWQWDVKEINSLNITDNVVDLMAQKIKELSTETQEILKLAACIGNIFDLKTLSAISTTPKGEIAKKLWESMAEGLTPALDKEYQHFIVDDLSDEQDGNATYRFLHDRIQQAAYSLIPISERPMLHLKIGRLLLKETTAIELEDNLFDCINHVNQGIELIEQKKERIRYAELNLDAGLKAKASTAFQSAMNYLEKGIAFLPKNSWKSKKLTTLSYNLHINLAEAAYLNNDREKSTRLLDLLIDKTTNKISKAKVYLQRGIVAQNIGDTETALKEYIAGLQLFGMEVPAEVTPEMIGTGLARIEELRAGRPIAEIADLPMIENEEKYTVILLILFCATPAFFTNVNLWTWLILKGISTSMEYGNADISDTLYPPFGMFLGQALGDFENGYEWGMVGVKLNRRLNNVDTRSKVNVVFGNMVSHWRIHLKENIPFSREGFSAGMETGDFTFAAYSSFHLIYSLFLIGDPINEVYSESQKYVDFFTKTKQPFRYANLVLERMILALEGKTDAPTSLQGENYDELTQMELMNNEFIKIPIHCYYYVKLRLHALFGEYDKALAVGTKALALVEASLGMQMVPDQYFFHGLAIAASRPKATKKVQKELDTLQETLLGALEKWSQNAPMNFKHKYLLVKAENAKALGEIDGLDDLYEEAINLAKTNGFLQDAAIANELAGYFWLNREKIKIAKIYLIEAAYLYKQRGAKAKVKQLEKRYPSILTKRGLHRSNITMKSSNLTLTRSQTGANLDLQSIIKASTAISREVVLDKLLVTLLEIISENAGAQRSFLLSVDQHKELWIEAQGTIDEESIKIFKGVSVKNSDLLSAAIVQYVARTKKSIVLHDAIKSPQFGDTPYIQRTETKSVLCLPTLKQGNVQCIIYLENNLANGVFTKERIELLRLLSGQIAISFDNALLYQNLEQKVKERTATIEQQSKEIALEKQKSDDLLLNILPASIADELKEKGYATPQSYELVTVLFADIKGFTNISERLTPSEIIKELNECFSAFDEIVEENNLEKIKTIGDAYMCAGGLPIANKTNPKDAVKAGLAIQKFMDKWNADRMKNGKDKWIFRLGIHTGKVVSGVVGTKKFAYDIWGDAVNVASRMESSGEAGKINISGATYALIKQEFKCTYRGKIMAKNKGEVDMYFVEG